MNLPDRSVSSTSAPVSPPLADSRNFIAGFWRLADPKVTLASMASLFLGACAASSVGSLNRPWLVATVLGIFALEVAKNASGEVFDFDSGADPGVAPEDRSPFSGGKRVLVDGLLTRGETWGIAIAGYAIGIAIGLAIVVLREPRVLVPGIIGVGCAWFYHAPPFKLSYRGWGEAAVGLCYGPLIAVGTFLVQTGRVEADIVAASIPLGLMIAGFLWINEFPDYRSDLAAGKRNLVVRWGRDAARHGYVLIMGVAPALMLGLPLMGVSPGMALGAACLPAAALASCRVLKYPEQTAALVPAQAMTLVAFLMASLGMGIGMLVMGRPPGA